ncbi:MAG TPA: DIP1984 family protein [Candidatus Rubrimentiphilum sp.]|nr:DIP1984 family protein [Candidatus Rubrimentiphilum sp.]
MKLGEALKLRSDNFKKIDELRARAVASAQVQEGTQAPDSAAKLLEDIERLSAETKDLVQRINRTNVTVNLASGQTLADAIVERDFRISLRSQLDAVAKAAAEPTQRYLRSEIRVVRTVEPAALREREDVLAREARLLDVAIQEANWSNDLIA